MVRGTFGNVRLKNQLAPGTEGCWTTYLPTSEKLSVYEASLKYKETQTPLIVLAGKEYGTGSSRDWAAKGTMLLGIRAVLAESFERIHRSNLIGMGVLPLEFSPGESKDSLGFSGTETFDFPELNENLQPGQTIEVRVTSEKGEAKTFSAKVRIDTPVELEYYKNGGVLHMVLRRLIQKQSLKGE
jgi:aconitate hydratase